MSISHIQVLSMPVSDQQAARRFYTETLGLQLVRDNPMGEEARWVEVAPAGATTSIVLVTWFPHMPPGSVDGLVLQSDDVDADGERLRQVGITVDGPHEYPWGRQATLKDPDGNGLVLSSPPPAGV